MDVHPPFNGRFTAISTARPGQVIQVAQERRLATACCAGQQHWSIDGQKPMQTQLEGHLGWLLKKGENGIWWEKLRKFLGFYGNVNLFFMVKMIES